MNRVALPAGAERRRGAFRGFSLIELMITVAIVAIVAAIALPSYRRYVLQGNRTDAITALAFYQQALERCYTQSFTYVGCAQIPAPPVTTPNGDYGVAFTINAADYTIIATTVSTSPQAADTQCKTFQITQNGAQSAQDSSSNDQTQACWGGH